MMTQSLRDIAYLPDLYGQLDKLAELAIPEPWAFAQSEKPRVNLRTHILERHLYLTFEALMSCRGMTRGYTSDKNHYVYVTEKKMVFNTGLLTPIGQDIYAYLEPNRHPEMGRNWALLGFCTEASVQLAGIDPLPEPMRYLPDGSYGFHPDWPVRLNLDHMMYGEDNLQRLPPSVRTQPSLPMLLKASTEVSMRKARYTLGIAVPQWYRDHLQYLLPLYLTDNRYADVALALEPMNGFYVGHTALTLEMAYGNARLIARPEAQWLVDVVTGVSTGVERELPETQCVGSRIAKPQAPDLQRAGTSATPSERPSAAM